jgi:hypothetical protein
MVLFLISTLNDSDAYLDTCCCFTVPPDYRTSQLDEGILCVLALGKLSYGEVFSFFDERRPA